MAQTGTINLNDTTPAAPSGKVNVKWQADSNDPRNVSAYMPPMTSSAGGAVPTPPNDATKYLDGTGVFSTPAGGGSTVGGTNYQTGTTYTVVTGDKGKLVRFTNSSAVAVSLDAVGGSFGTPWFAWFENNGAGVVTITPGSGTINGAGTLVLNQNEGVVLFFDGTNYTCLPLTVHKIAGINVKVVTPTDADVMTYVAANSQWEPKSLASVGGANASQLRGVSLDTGTVGTPTDGFEIVYDSASSSYKAITPPAQIGANVVPLAHCATDGGSGWAGFSIIMSMPGRYLLALPAQWKFSIVIGTASMLFDNIKILKTNLDSSTVLSSTVVKFGGSATPTVGTGTTFCDPIALQLDAAHDWWIVAHCSASASGTSHLFKATTGPYVANTGFQSGFANGDHTGDATMPPGFGGGGFFFDQVLVVK